MDIRRHAEFGALPQHGMKADLRAARGGGDIVRRECDQGGRAARFVVLLGAEQHAGPAAYPPAANLLVDAAIALPQFVEIEGRRTLAVAGQVSVMVYEHISGYADAVAGPLQTVVELAVPIAVRGEAFVEAAHRLDHIHADEEAEVPQFGDGLAAARRNRRHLPGEPVQPLVAEGCFQDAADHIPGDMDFVGGLVLLRPLPDGHVVDEAALVAIVGPRTDDGMRLYLRVAVRHHAVQPVWGDDDIVVQEADIFRLDQVVDALVVGFRHARIVRMTIAHQPVR